VRREFHFFIPVFFDTISFRKLRENLLRETRSFGKAQFYLLDDSAGADSEVRKLQFDDLKVVEMPFNMGHQRALVYGLRNFLKSNDPSIIVVTLDGDGEDCPEDFPKLIKAYEENESTHSIVLAFRTKRQESLIFKCFYLLYKSIFRILTGTVIQTGNFALMPATALKKIISHPYFDLAYSSTLLSLGAKLVFVPCARGMRYEGKSKMNFLRLALHGLSMLMPFIDKIAVRGLVTSAFLFMVGLLSATWFLIENLSAINGASRALLYISLSSFGLSLVLASNFVILLTVFSNVQGLAMARLQEKTSKRMDFLEENSP